MYDYIIVTHLPAFYKVNLYNEIAKKLNIFVVFIAIETNEKRSSDFTSIANASFQYMVLSDLAFQSRNKLKTIFRLFSVMRNSRYKRILISGWDLPEFWVVAILSSNKKNHLALESTVIESNIIGMKGVMKRVFLSMIGTVFASGKLHVDLLRELNYKKKTILTKGVGIINKPIFEKSTKEYQKRFLFVGRLTKVKNLELLINVFNELPSYQLTIIGDGEEKLHLKNIAKNNIKFIAPIKNKKLKHEFYKNDIFILPSVSETWGLVVEEALYFGLPVIVSNQCGASELVINGENGYVFSPSNKEELVQLLNKIDKSSYRELRSNVALSQAEVKDIDQVKCYEFIR